MKLSYAEIEALEVVIGSLHPCWYKNVLQGLFDRCKSENAAEHQKDIDSKYPKMLDAYGHPY